MQLKQLIPNISDLIPYEYSEIKTPQYENILNDFLKMAPSVSEPVLYHMFGIPGAGKSTFYRQHSWPQHILVAFDDIMEKLPQYQNDLQKFGPVLAFQKWEIPARVIGYELLRRAIDEHKNIFFDHSAANTAHVNLIKNVPNYGYKTEMYQISCSLDTALQRVKDRESIINRHTPENLVRQRYEQVTKLAEQYKTIVDVFCVYDNSCNKFVLLSKVDKQNTLKIA